ncbi:MAG: DUF4365 domain-containing protein [Alphaproteobacteria bacterium]|nr:DUF4365 domain-containing protein [Alphaproteobacteria bacterium]
MSTMHISHQQEAFSRAYVRAVAAAAGFRVQAGADPDDDSVDLTLSARGAGGTLRSPKLDVQLKCQLGLPEGASTWTYDLKMKNYDELRPTDLMVPRVLVIVAVPESVADWVEQDEQRLLLRHCGWWLSLRGLPAVDNTATRRLHVPRSQRFDVAGLQGIMDRVGQGGTP